MKTRRLVAKRAGYRCEYCQSQELILGMPLEIEHIMPISVGGKTKENNLCLSCPRCNRYKGVQVDGYDADTDTVVTLFNPRKDKWQDHFVWSSDGLYVIGLTAEGRVTAE